MFDLKEFLEMEAEERMYWLEENGCMSEYESLADLAFRLRDEAEKLYTDKKKIHPLYVAMNKVWGELQFSETYGFEPFWLYQSQPIHWIAAALEAMKEKE